MEWIFRIGYLFAIIWAFAYATNGSWRMNLAKIGIFGLIGTIGLSIIFSIITKSLLFVGVIVESIIVLFVFTIIFNFLFRNVKKQTDFRSSEKFAKDMIKEIRKGKSQ